MAFYRVWPSLQSALGIIKSQKKNKLNYLCFKLAIRICHYQELLNIKYSLGVKKWDSKSYQFKVKPLVSDSTECRSRSVHLWSSWYFLLCTCLGLKNKQTSKLEYAGKIFTCWENTYIYFLVSLYYFFPRLESWAGIYS